jgi:hypothetical protein
VRQWCFVKYNFFLCFASVSWIWKSKRPIKTLNMIFILKISLEIKFYNFFWKFCYFVDEYKVCWSSDFCTIQYQWFLTHLSNNKKNQKKYKIWSPKIFQYEDHIQWFELVVWTFWIWDTDTKHERLCASRSTIVSLYI